LLAGITVLAGCAAQPGKKVVRAQTGESVVLVGEQPSRLAFPPLARGSVHVRSTYLDNAPATVHYEEGRDFAVDYTTGKITRTGASRIPDFQTNMLFGKEDFDHSKYPGYGNLRFFAFVDYGSQGEAGWLRQPSQAEFLPRTQQKLRDGDKVKVVAFGDSITAGGEATQPGLIYWQRWADALQKKYPEAQITTVNGATGGDTTRNGLERLEIKVLSQKPDLVLVAFGMNDNNLPPFGVPPEEFAQNLRRMIDRIRGATQAEIILLSTFPPNPKWHFGSRATGDYARITAQVAREKCCAFADIYHNWLNFSAAKKPEDLLGNNINHPNDFGHGIYFQVLNQLGL
jgi:acyl-CoA thioesterase-1